VLSAGPNGIIDTPHDDAPVPGGDDIAAPIQRLPAVLNEVRALLAERGPT